CIINVYIQKEGFDDIYSYNVTVIEALASSIIGKTEVCQGEINSRYRVNNNQDLNKVYVWQTQNHSFVNISNGFITIDWLNIGSDTIILIDYNNKTKCQSKAVLPITIHPLPKPAFTMQDNGNGDVVFNNTSFAGTNGYITKTVWKIENKTYITQKHGVLLYNFEKPGYKTVSLDVTNNFGCSFGIETEVEIKINTLFVPTAICPNAKEEINREFKPIAENLQQYSINIYNRQGHKLWSSSVIIDGKPAFGWDGTVNGVLQPQGVYYWEIEATFTDGNEWRGVWVNGRYLKKGTFSIIYK
ncbi:MAG: gliding motility-associated C-terminal domain-containing protein, partial [Bacteroidales bacterium]